MRFVHFRSHKVSHPRQKRNQFIGLAVLYREGSAETTCSSIQVSDRPIVNCKMTGQPVCNGAGNSMDVLCSNRSCFIDAVDTSVSDWVRFGTEYC